MIRLPPAVIKGARSVQHSSKVAVSVRLLAVVSLMGWGSAQGMVRLDDQDLAQVTGQDGLSVNMPSGNLSATEVGWTMDDSTLNEASVIFRDVSLTGDVGSGFNMDFQLDVGGSTTTGTGASYPMLRGTWGNILAEIGAFGHSQYPTNSGGTIGVRTGGSLVLGSQGGMFSPLLNNSQFQLTTLGDIYIRQGAVGTPEFSFGDINFGARFTDGAGNAGFGIVGLDATGLLLQAPFMDFDLNFDIFFAANPATSFDETAREPIILFGWEGGLRNATLRLSPGGIGYGTGTPGPSHPDFAAMVTAPSLINPAWNSLQYFNHDGLVLPGGRSDGLNMLAQWDYDTNFRFILGQAAGDRIRVDFYDWRTMGTAPYDFRMPITLDAINAGQGPGGICFGGTLPTAGSLNPAGCTTIGGEFYNIPPEHNNLAVIIRDGRLHAHNSMVRVTDGPTVEDFPWSLVYTFGKLDANIYLYPGGKGVTGPATALGADILFSLQSPGYWRAAQVNFDTTADSGIDPTARSRWATNTHFAIADTAVNGNPAESFVLGVLNADLIWRAENFRLELHNAATGTLPGLGSGFPGMHLRTNDLGQYRFRGVFAGGPLDDLSNPIRLSLVDANLLTDQFIFVLSPPNYSLTGDQFIGFDAIFDFRDAGYGDNAYISLAEPSNPKAQFTVGNISGRLAWIDGKVELTSAAVNPDNKPKLTIENELWLGTTGGGNELLGWVKFGEDLPANDVKLMQLAINSGRWYQSFSLKKQ